MRQKIQIYTSLLLFVTIFSTSRIIAQVNLCNTGSARVLFEKDLKSTQDDIIQVTVNPEAGFLLFHNKEDSLIIENISDLILVNSEEHIEEAALKLFSIEFYRGETHQIGRVLFSSISDRDDFTNFLEYL